MDISRFIEELIEGAREHNINSLIVEAKGLKIGFEFEDANPIAKKEQKTDTVKEEIKEIKEKKALEVKSEYVGIFTIKKKGKELISVGKEVKEGDVVGIVKSINVEHEIKSPFAGIVKEIVVEDEHPVEYNETVIILEGK